MCENYISWWDCDDSQVHQGALARRIDSYKERLSPNPSSSGCWWFKGGGSAFVDSLFIVGAIVCGASVFGPCIEYALLSVLSCFEIILTRKGELVALLQLFSWCLMTVNILWLFFTVPWVGLQCMNVVIPGHTLFTWVTYLFVVYSVGTFEIFQSRPSVRGLFRKKLG